MYLCFDTSFTAVSRSPLIHVENDRQHTCLWSKLTHLFPGDSEFGEEDNSWCDSEGEPCDESTASSDEENATDHILPVSESPGTLSQILCFNHIGSHRLAHYLVFNPIRSAI